MVDPHPRDRAEVPASSARGQRTAARLRAAGTAAFAELGWEHTRVEDVVTRAGVSHGTFYTYFTNKSALLDALVRDSQADFDALGRRPWDGRGVRGAIEGVIGGFLDLYARDAAVMRTWLEAARSEPEFADLYLRSREVFTARIAENLDAAVAASGRRGASSRAVASALAAMVEHFAYCWIVLGEPHDRDEAITALVTVWGSALNELADRRLVAVPADA